MKKINSSVIVFFIVLILLLIFNTIRVYQEINTFTNSEYESKKNALNIIVYDMKKVSNSIFENIINTPSVLTIFKDAYKSDDAQKAIIRKKLYDLLQVKYTKFTKYDIQQLHFHLPNNDSFLRFHKPKKFGDNLTNVRASVKYVNAYKKPIIGFEEGRIFNGYRFVYPLFFNNEHIGSVEISSSLLSFKRIFERNNNEHLDFILFKKNVERKVFKKQLSNYIEYKPFKYFYMQKNIEEFNTKYCKHSLNITQFLNNIDEKKLLKQPHKNLFYTKFSNGKLYTMYFIPLLNDFTKEHMGYSIIFEKSKYLDYFFISFFLSYISVFIFALISGIVVLLFENIQNKKNNIKLILNNANDGFISFSLKDYKILDNASQKSCEILEQKSLKERNIKDILFKENLRALDTFATGIEAIINLDDTDAINMILTLLPSELIINKKIIRIEYKLINQTTMMLILQDITQQSLLQSKYEEESKNQKMIITAAKNKDVFLETRDEFQIFLNNLFLDTNIDLKVHLTTLNQKLHTFKGIFYQHYFALTPDAIHKLETELYKFKEDTTLNTNDLNQFLIQYDLERYFEKDLEKIYAVLGKNYFDKNDEVCFTHEMFDTIEAQVVELSQTECSDNFQYKINTIKKYLQTFNEKNLFITLEQFKPIITDTAKKLSKEIFPLEIHGDKSLKLEGKYNNFIKSLIHIFNNMVDHGIESPQERIKLKKNPKGKIICLFEINKFSNLLTITIKDDGKGINPDIIKGIALTQNLYTQAQLDQMKEEDVLKIIFKESFSTKSTIDALSGRGVGLSAVEKEVSLLNGIIQISSKKDHYTEFKFILPF